MRSVSFFLDGLQLKTALLSVRGKEIKIIALRTFSSTVPISDVKQLYTQASCTSEKSLLTVSGLESHEVLLRQTSLPLTNPLKVQSALPFQLEALLPYPSEEAVVVPISEKRSGKQTTIQFFAASKTQIKTHLEKYSRSGIEPDLLSSTSAALGDWARFAYPNVPSIALLDLGGEKSTLVCIQENELKLAHSIHFGIEDLHLAFAQDMPQLSKDEAAELAKEIDLATVDKEKHSHLHRQAERFQKELERAILYLQQKLQLPLDFPIVLTGEISSHCQWERWVKNIVRSSFSFVEACVHPLFAAPSLHAYAIPIGLCLNALNFRGNAVQFLQGKETPLSFTRKKLTPFALYAVICLFLAAGTALISSIWKNQKEEHLYKELLSMKETSSDQKGSKALLEEELFSWERLLNQQKRPFPFDPSVPKVSDILAYLSTHPMLTLNRDKEGIEIKQLRYRLVKYPNAGSVNEPYMAKVDLEFTATSPKFARDFHESLQKGDLIINSKTEISWNVKDGVYHTSFFLKKQGGV